MLELNDVGKRFGNTVALANVSFAVRRSTVHALLGENGAGKSTLMRIAFGMLQPSSGTMSIDGSARRFASPADAIDAGIGMVHQHFTHVEAMTVAENVALGHSGRYDGRRAAARVVALGERTGLALDPATLAGDLPVGGQQRLEILKALGRNAKLLILDEPTAVLAPAEADELLGWLRRFADAGNGVVLITHKLPEALAIADDVTVLRRGRCVAAARATEMSLLSLAAAMLGEEPPPEHRRAETVGGDIVAFVQDVEVRDPRGVPTVRDASLEVRAGEIVGIAAVEGAGQRDLLRAMARRVSVSRGAATLPDRIAFVPEDRHSDALVLDFTETENILLKDAGMRRGVIDWRAAQNRSRGLAESFDVRGSSPRGAVRSLSGGNQQKLVLARELDGSPALVVAENPSRGLDIRATRAVHDRLREAASRGAGVVVYSTDLDEVLGLATRVVVMHNGRLIDVGSDRDAVGRAMLGLGAA